MIKTDVDDPSAVKLDLSDQASLAKDLLESDAWRLLLEPHLRTMAQKHNNATKARNLSPAQRAEHIEAAHALDDLLAWPTQILAAHKAKISEKKPQ